jgi:hypothetical protein
MGGINTLQESALQFFGFGRVVGVGRFFLGWSGPSLDQTAYAGQDEKADQSGVFQVFEPGEQNPTPDQEGKDKDSGEKGVFVVVVHGLSLQKGYRRLLPRPLPPPRRPRAPGPVLLRPRFEKTPLRYSQ